MLFPTLRKARISSRLSYPIGAQAISNELADVPQAQSLDICFRDKYETLKTRGASYTIFEVSYSGTRWYQPGWHIVVQPVPKEMRHVVNQALKTEFFPAIRMWLKGHELPADEWAVHGIRVIFDEKSETALRLVPGMYNKSD